MSKLQDLTGRQFGELTVVERAGTSPSGNATWKCKCSCGNPIYIIAKGSKLKSGDIKSCGCIKYKRDNILGQKFGQLTVKKMIDNDRKCECMCECGNIIIVADHALKSGHVKSCGCLKGEHHGDASHKYGRTRLYRIWQDMKQRCSNKKRVGFKHYGGKGVSVCDDWVNSYKTFKKWAIENGYSDNLTLDRIDVNGNYCPDNCRWVTYELQANNTTQNRLITFNGETLTLTQWSKRLGFKRGVLEYRIKNGWSVEKALTTPVK